MFKITVEIRWLGPWNTTSERSPPLSIPQLWTFCWVLIRRRSFSIPKVPKPCKDDSRCSWSSNRQQVPPLPQLLATCDNIAQFVQVAQVSWLSRRWTSDQIHGEIRYISGIICSKKTMTVFGGRHSSVLSADVGFGRLYILVIFSSYIPWSR
jgi:hypothetical protein